MTTQKPRALILGCGYTGTVLRTRLIEQGFAVHTTNRVSKNHSLTFALNNKLSWQNLPEVDVTFWTFATNDLNLTQEFWQSQSHKLGKTILIGSTSNYKHDDFDIVDENFSWDMNLPRAVCEKYLQEKGVVIALSAGIYGPQRNPLNWLKRGLISHENDWVNLIHVDDLVTTLIQAFWFGDKGDIFNVSDGETKSWQEIAKWALAKNYLNKWPDFHQTSPKKNKKITNQKMRALLKVSLAYPDVFCGVDHIYKMQTD